MKNKNTHEHTNHDVIDLTDGNNHHHCCCVNEEFDVLACIEQELQQELDNQRHIEEELMMEAEDS